MAGDRAKEKRPQSAEIEKTWPTILYLRLDHPLGRSLACPLLQDVLSLDARSETSALLVHNALFSSAQAAE